MILLNSFIDNWPIWLRVIIFIFVVINVGFGISMIFTTLEYERKHKQENQHKQDYINSLKHHEKD